MGRSPARALPIGCSRVGAPSLIRWLPVSLAVNITCEGVLGMSVNSDEVAASVRRADGNIGGAAFRAAI